jgi:O-antigen/teichoic acid export membrane protein
VGGTKKNYIYNTLQYIANLIFPLITFPYVSRILGPEGTGKIAFISSFTQYFILVALFGIGIYGSREIARCRNDVKEKNVIFSELLSMHILHSVLLTIVYLFIIFTFYTFQVDIKYYIISGLTIFLSFLNVDWFLSAIEKFRLMALRNIFFKILSVICLFLLVKHESDLFIYFIINIIVTIGTYIVSWSAVSGHVRFRFKFTFRHYHTTSILFLSLLINGIYFISDVIILGLFADDIHVGYYNAALRSVRMLLFFIYAYHGVILPSMNNAVAENRQCDFKQLLRKSFSFTSLVAIPLSVVVFIYAEPTMLILAGDKYLLSIPVTKVLAPVIIFNGFSSYYLGVLLAKKADVYRLIGVSGAACISVVLSCILIPFLGCIGSAISTLTAEFVAGGIYIYFVSIQYQYKFDYKTIFQAIFSCLPFIFSAFIFDSTFLNMMIGFFLGISGYIIMQLLMFKNLVLIDIMKQMKRYFSC